MTCNFLWKLRVGPPQRGSKYFSLLETNPSAKDFLLLSGIFLDRNFSAPACLLRTGKSGFSPSTRLYLQIKYWPKLTPRSLLSLSAYFGTSSPSSFGTMRLGGRPLFCTFSVCSLFPISRFFTQLYKVDWLPERFLCFLITLSVLRWCYEGWIIRITNHCSTGWAIVLPDYFMHSFTYNKNKIGPRTDPCGTPLAKGINCWHFGTYFNILAPITQVASDPFSGVFS